MSDAKYNFLKRMKSFRRALDSDMVQVRNLADRDHNEVTKLFRNGLAVIGFTFLEDFIRYRTGELFVRLGANNLSFARLPEEIKEAATLKALRSLQYRAEMMKKNEEDWLGFVRGEMAKVGSSLGTPYEFSSFSLGWDKANLQHNDLPEFLRIFLIKGGWTAIEVTSRKVKSAVLKPSDVFKSAMLRRNAAAHDALADTPLADLIQFSEHAVTLAFCYDVLLSQGFFRLKEAGIRPGTSIQQIEANELKFRFLIESGLVWKEKLSLDSGRAIKNSFVFEDALSLAKNRSRGNHEFLVIKNKEDKIIDWETFP